MKELLEKIDKEFTQLLFDSIPRLIAFLDNDFNFLLVNKEYANADYERSKGSTDFFIGKNHFDLYPNEENKKLFMSVAKTGQSIYVFDKPFEYPDGRKQYFDWTLVPISSGELKGLVLTIAEVTERTLMQLDLKFQEFNLQQIIEHANEGIILISPSGTILFCNNSFSSILGFSNNYELYNKNILDFIVNKPMGYENKRLIDLYPIQERSIEIKLTTVTEDLKYTYMSIVPLKKADTKEINQFLCFFIDITDMYKYEEQLLKQRNELEQYSSFIAHDFRNNLNKIEQYNSIVKEAINDYPVNTQLILDSLNKISEQTKITSYFLSRALDLARIGKIIQTEEIINFKKLFETIKETLTSEKSAIQWIFPDRYPKVLCEESNIYHLFINLFSNSLKHSLPTKITMEFIDINNLKEFLIKITYDGVPFPQFILDKFLNNEPLSGFGMLIIKKILDAHKWKLKISIINIDGIDYTMYEITIPGKKIISY